MLSLLAGSGSAASGASMTFVQRALPTATSVGGASILLAATCSGNPEPALLSVGAAMMGMPTMFRSGAGHEPVEIMGCEVVGGDFASTKCNWGTSGCRLQHKGQPNPGTETRRVATRKVERAPEPPRPSTKGELLKSLPDMRQFYTDFPEGERTNFSNEPIA